jgi:RimJ/RimL family protein N-acetyltransferase
MDMAIRRIEAGDVEGFHRTVDAVARERKYLVFLEGFPLETTREFVMNNIAKGHAQFVAISGREVVGWCDIRPNSHFTCGHSGMLGMGLLPVFRGKGIGTLLIRATINEARRQGLTRIELTVFTDNARAIALYEKVGFTTEGVMRNAVRIDGIYKDLRMMAMVDPPLTYATSVRKTKGTHS